MTISKPYKAAVVQAAPDFLNLQGSVDKAISLIEEAARNGARLVSFPECFLPGYPFWVWLDAPIWGMQFVQRYFNNAMLADGVEAQRLLQAAIDNDIFVSMGYVEKAGGTLYIAQLFLDPVQRRATPRRKLKATHVERTVFGEGDGSDFAVFDTEIGKLGQLCCWEHLHPLNKFAMYSMHEQVHLAAWPCFALYQGKAYALGPELNNSVSQVYAAEGGCFVLAATSVMTEAQRDVLCQTDAHRDLLPLGGGSSMIFGPDGSRLCEPLAADEEGLLYADIDLDLIALAKTAADPVGHYARNDVFRVFMDQGSRSALEASQAADAYGRSWQLLDPED
ncbi:carbon-nitrogen hydrolase family protein [Aurantiacibacter xanthus]|uniref:Carbon-nitrogen hydrolase family protein n=1 Tax=Aurantiacibacter xanthus TaxID=1784712 RepID=A0A3A1P588_9SPHN|nr:carbon-nitrogen hydrolase family protein [Aurantiacibacter xanthus]RIV82234.1 carbon-nitrogen hydrolase family protein [Aurantiacibacter xanthus]